MRIEISFPKDLNLDKGDGILNMPIEKIKTNSFGSAQFFFKSFIKDIFFELPIISFHSKHGEIELKARSLNLEISPYGGRGDLVSSKNKNRKLISEKDLDSLNIDSNYLFTSILGSLGLLDKKVKTKIILHFEKLGIFKGSFNDKVHEDFLKQNSADEVFAISFKRKIVFNKLETELKFEFERNDKDEIRVTEQAEMTFSPFNTSSIIERKLKEINEILEGW